MSLRRSTDFCCVHNFRAVAHHPNILNLWRGTMGMCRVDQSSWNSTLPVEEVGRLDFKPTTISATAMTTAYEWLLTFRKVSFATPLPPWALRTDQPLH